MTFRRAGLRLSLVYLVGIVGSRIAEISVQADEWRMHPGFRARETAATSTLRRDKHSDKDSCVYSTGSMRALIGRLREQDKGIGDVHVIMSTVVELKLSRPSV